MDPSFLALAERCAPGVPAAPLAAFVREASGFEPLLITLRGAKPMRIRPMTRAEAIELASQALLAGERVALGLTQIDGASLGAQGLTLADAFDGCRHLRAVAGRLPLPVNEGVQEPIPETDEPTVPVSAPAGSVVPSRPPTPRRAAVPGGEARLGAPAAAAASWNVYAAGSRASVFVYGR